MYGVQDKYISNRVNVITSLDHRQLLTQLPQKIKTQAFFSARVSEARILERLRSISDMYSRGELSLGEARTRLKQFLQGSGYNPHEAGLKNLASTARLNLVLQQNSSMAKAVGDYHRMHKEENMKVFPYVRYHSRNDSRSRSSHADLDGKIFHKNDPFLRTHTPPWEFNCRCYLEEITEKEANKTPALIQKETPMDQVRVESKSGFAFDPVTAFDEFDLSKLTLKSRGDIIQSAAEEIKKGNLNRCGLICAAPTKGLPPHQLTGLNEVKKNFESMKAEVHKYLKSYGIDPNNITNADYKKINKIIGKKADKLPDNIKNLFATQPIEVGHLNKRFLEALDIPDIPVQLKIGKGDDGITHLWHDHKDIFADPDKAVSFLQDTLGNPNCRVVMSLTKTFFKHKGHRNPITQKRIVINNPDNDSYCVMLYDENAQTLNLMSWHDANSNYGNNQWQLK